MSFNIADLPHTRPQKTNCSIAHDDKEPGPCKICSKQFVKDHSMIVHVQFGINQTSSFFEKKFIFPDSQMLKLAAINKIK